MTTTPTPSPEAEALPTLPVVAWRTRHRSEPGMIGHYPWSFTDRVRGMQLQQYEYEPLTPHAPAEAAIVALRDDRDSWCQQASARAEDAVRFAAERDALRAEVAELRKERDEAMVRLDTALATCNDWFKANGPGGWIDELRRRASLLGDRGTL